MPEFRRKLSRGHTLSASIRGGISAVSQEQSSNLSTYMPKKMIHPIASLVNPHAQLAAIEAQQAEQEYMASREHSSMSLRASGGSRIQYSASKNRPVSMTRQNINITSRPNTSHSTHQVSRPASVAGPMMPARALSRAESLHSRAENLASWKSFNKDMAYGQDILIVPLTPRPTEVQEIYTQNSLEEFYQLTDGYYPPKLPKYHHPVVHKPKPPGSSTKSDHLDPSSRATSAKTAPLGRDLLGKGENEKKEDTPRGQSNMKLNAVVNMIDTVSGEMSYYKEKLAPSPAPGFRQPSSTGVSRRPLSRPATASGRRSPSPIQPSPVQRTNSPSIIWQRQKFGEHSFVKKLYPGKRPVGATHAGNRPKTAPMTVREKWKIEEKPNEGNIRVSSQAATNTMTLVDEKTMDNIMMVQPIEHWNTGFLYYIPAWVKRLGSMNSIYLDENFLRSFSSGRYTPGTTVTATPVPMEYVPIVATAPKGLVESRAHSRQTRKSDRADSRFEGPSVELEDEEQTRDTFNVTAADSQEAPHNFETFTPDTVHLQTEENTDRQEDSFDATDRAVQTDISRINEKEDIETARSVYNEEVSRKIDDLQEERSDVCSVDANVTNPNQQVQFYTEDLHHGKVHIEVIAVPSGGRPPTPPHERDGTSPQQLTKSDTWQFSPLEENSRPYLDLRKKTLNPDLYHKGEHWTKAIVKPENYCFHCLPDNMSTKVGRSAGRMPARTQSASSQVLRMARKQNEYFKKAPPVRTPPSIPRPYHQTLGHDTPRQGEMYKAELEHHARKVKSPRHFMEQVVELRKGAIQSAPPGSVFVREDSLLGTSLQVCRLPTRSSGFGTSDEVGEESREMGRHVMFDESERKALERETTMDSISSRNVTARGVPLTKQSIAHIGRPIAQVSNIHDPLEEAEAARIQFEAKAAVDIQRIFRGYVARNVYKKLLKEEREKREDEQKAAVEIQRIYRGHLIRKKNIEKKTGLSPELLQWAKEFKEVQTENAAERQRKMTVLSQTNSMNYHKANSKISVIGPHVEIYQIYHPKQTGPTKEELTLAAIAIQKHIRGFIIRKRFERLERKAVWHGSTFSKMVREYKNMLRKCQQRHGVDRPKTPFTIQDFNEYLDMRKRYESVFDKKSFGNELELVELEAFFRESDMYPSASEIDEAMDVVFHGREVKRGLLKNEVLEMIFYIYVPKATGLPMTRQSTWLNPIIDGVEARKLIVASRNKKGQLKRSEFVEKAPLEVCAKLVIDSKRERRERENQEKERKLDEELAKTRKTPSSRGSNKTEL